MPDCRVFHGSDFTVVCLQHGYVGHYFCFRLRSIQNMVSVAHGKSLYCGNHIPYRGCHGVKSRFTQLKNFPLQQFCRTMAFDSMLSTCCSIDLLFYSMNWADSLVLLGLQHAILYAEDLLQDGFIDLK